jgi:peptidoglycan hydrolase FlgJ
MTDMDISKTTSAFLIDHAAASGNALPTSSKDLSESQLEKACRDFESLFVQYMMQQMRQTVPSDGLFSGGSAEKLYTSMLDGEVSKTVSSQRGIGLAPALIREFATIDQTEKK